MSPTAATVAIPTLLATFVQSTGWLAVSGAVERPREVEAAGEGKRLGMDEELKEKDGRGGEEFVASKREKERAR